MLVWSMRELHSCTSNLSSTITITCPTGMRARVRIVANGKGSSATLLLGELIKLFLNSTSSDDSYWREELKGYWYLNASMFLPFVELKSLSLGRNAIAGCVENEDQTQLRLTKLEEFDLSGNLFRNNTFPSLKGLSSLKSLNMGDNDLRGSLDLKGLNHSTNLKRLDLSYNQIESLLSYKGLSSLKTLNMQQNMLEGSLDLKGLNDLIDLKELDLSQNQIESLQSYEGLSNLTKLKILDLSGNEIESLEGFKDAATATKLKLFTHLEELNLDYNHFNNSVFASLNGFANLKSLSGSVNQLKGSLEMKDLDVFANLRELDLSSNQLKDFGISRGLCHLNNLQVLDLSRNAFEGMLPHCFSNFTSLREFDLSRNQFSGNLAPLPNLTSLKLISLSRNHFQIPLSFLSHLPNLQFLSIDENKMVIEPSYINTPVPKFQLKFFSMGKYITSPGLGLEFLTFLYYQYDLRSVDLSGNNFGGTFPAWLLKNNTKLKYLILRDNSFSGPLSLSSAPNVNLSLLDISGNNLQGQISSNICSIFPHLRLLVLSKNAFEGNIPPCFSGMKDLEFSDLSNNQLSGRVPEGLIMNSSISVFRLSNNNLSGSVVPVILNANGLDRLYLDGNNFSGEMTNIGVSVFEIPTSLKEIDISNNKLYGKLPGWIGNMYLDTLDLSNNRFEGSIPKEFCNLNDLRYLDLSQNNLSGSIPSCFNPPGIRHVHLHSNRLSGPFSLAFYNSSSLVTLDLRGNNLSGGIPKWIGKLSSLSVLLLKANYLQGRIPVQLCNLYSLNILDLSQNMFSGPIPSCLGNLTLLMQGNKVVQNAKHGFISEEDESTIVGSTKLNNLIYYDYPTSYMQEWIEFSTKRGSYLYGGFILEIITGIDFLATS